MPSIRIRRLYEHDELVARNVESEPLLLPAVGSRFHHSFAPTMHGANSGLCDDP
jgi:hypothetical protein